MFQTLFYFIVNIHVLNRDKADLFSSNIHLDLALFYWGSEKENTVNQYPYSFTVIQFMMIRFLENIHKMIAIIICETLYSLFLLIVFRIPRQIKMLQFYVTKLHITLACVYQITAWVSTIIFHCVVLRTSYKGQNLKEKKIQVSSNRKLCYIV